MLFTPQEWSSICQNLAPLSSNGKDFSHRDIYIYGTGINQLILYRCFVDSGVPVVGFVVSVKSISSFCERPVFSVDQLKNNSGAVVVLSGGFALEMAENCLRNNISFAYPRDFVLKGLIAIGTYPLLIHEFTENAAYEKLYQILGDSESRMVLKDLLYFRLTLDLTPLKKYSSCKSEHYFSPSLKREIDYSMFCDCGAYTGDTFSIWRDYICQFMPSSCKYYGIEGYHENFEKLSAVVSNSGIDFELFNNVISDSCGKVFSFGAGKESSSINFYEDSSTGASTASVTLDALFENREVSVIKADIEGAEIPLLEGAKKTIRDQRPALLISAYHKTEDLYAIPFKILEIDPNYTIYLRQHMPHFTETVCYAIPR